MEGRHVLGLGDWLSAAGLLVSIVGFTLAIQQLRKTTSAAVATQQAIKSTSNRLSLNHLLVLLPQLRMIEGDLDAAAADDDARLAVRSLVAYSHTATQVASLLGREDASAHADLIAKLLETSRQASTAKSKLVTSGGQGKPVKVLTRTALQSIGNLSSEAAGLAAKIQARGD